MYLNVKHDVKYVFIFSFNCITSRHIISLKLQSKTLMIENIFDINQDGRINYDEFVAMMRKGQQDAATNPKKRRESFVA